MAGKAILCLDFQFLKELLELPEDCKIIMVESQMRNKTLALLLESPQLPEVAEVDSYPDAQARCTVDFHPDDRSFVKRKVTVEVPAPAQTRTGE